MTDHILFDWLREIPDELLEVGRDAGHRLAAGDSPVSVMNEFPLASIMNFVGTPFMAVAPIKPRIITLVERCALLEILGYLDPNLAFASPGPGLSAFVVQQLGTEMQKNLFFDRFSHGLHWTFFALTEPHAGSDPQQCRTTAVVAPGGFRICGSKMLVGNGKFASVGVVFARTHPGVLGINAFLIEKETIAGLLCTEYETVGCKASRLSLMEFNDTYVSDSSMLGQHLKPTERWSKSASAAFTALRPCIAAIALGIARSAIDHFRHLCPKSDYQDLYVEVLAQRRLLHQICDIHDAGARDHIRAGFFKTIACNTSERLVTEVIRRCCSSGVSPDDRLRKAYRDVKAFEYTEGMSYLHYSAAGFLSSYKFNSAENSEVG